MNAIYTKEIRKSLGYCATWLPNTALRLGDVGVLKGYIYRRVGAATDFGLQFTTRRGPGRAVVDHTSTDSVHVSIVGAAQGPLVQTAPAKARGSLEISFARAEAVMFQAGPTTVHELEDINAVGRQILDFYQRGEWREEYVLITELVEAARTTVLVANGKEAKVVFTADASVEFGPTSLIDSKIGLQLESAHNIGTRIISESGLTPLFRAFAVRKPLLRPGRFGPIRAPREPSFQDVDYDDFA